MNRNIGKYFISLSFLLRASKVLRMAHLVLNFDCFEVADGKNRFYRFSPNSSGLSENKLRHV